MNRSLKTIRVSPVVIFILLLAVVLVSGQDELATGTAMNSSTSAADNAQGVAGKTGQIELVPAAATANTALTDGVWLTNTGRSVYFQTYDNGGAILVSTQDGKMIIAAYDDQIVNNTFDGVDIYGGKLYRFVMEFQSAISAKLTIYSLSSSDTRGASTESCSRFAIASPVRGTDGIWKDSATSIENFYAQTYTDGSMIMLITMDGRNISAYYDSMIVGNAFDGLDLYPQHVNRLVFQFSSEDAGTATLFDLSQHPISSWACFHSSKTGTPPTTTTTTFPATTTTFPATTVSSTTVTTSTGTTTSTATTTSPTTTIPSNPTLKVDRVWTATTEGGAEVTSFSAGNSLYFEIQFTVGNLPAGSTATAFLSVPGISSLNDSASAQINSNGSYRRYFMKTIPSGTASNTYNWTGTISVSPAGLTDQRTSAFAVQGGGTYCSIDSQCPTVYISCSCYAGTVRACANGLCLSTSAQICPLLCGGPGPGPGTCLYNSDCPYVYVSCYCGSGYVRSCYNGYCETDSFSLCLSYCGGILDQDNAGSTISRGDGITIHLDPPSDSAGPLISGSK
ncbi:MAG: hypothetical protein HQK56_13785 [Deltaproteobacteria bacterium]|nr:hypothetical protein [Deltaproteobacteria bacterium]